MCKTSCWGAGAGGCDDCKDGWTTTDYGCFDINECIPKPGEYGECGYREYCLNTPGSFKCNSKYLSTSTKEYGECGYREYCLNTPDSFKCDRKYV